MLYEDQAAQYDERAAIPADAAERAATALDGLVGLSADCSLLEPGVGTGLISIHLLRYPIRYVGFDRSPAMLEVFARKAAAVRSDIELLLADGNDRWPAIDRSIDVVFCARALHHMAPEHVANEIDRVRHATGGWLVVAKVSRPRESPKSQMRRQMRRTLRESGIDGRNHEHHTEDVFALLEARGAHRIETIVAAQWTTRYRPLDSLVSWAGKDGLAGVEIEDATKTVVLEKVRDWAVEFYGDIEQEIDQEEFIELHAVRLGNR